MSSIQLPDDIVVQILTRLPSKCLIRCKCVCRSWCSLISHPQFLTKHLFLDYNNDDNGHLLIKRRSKATKAHVYSLLSYQTLREGGYDHLRTQALPYPELRHKEADIRMLSLFDGTLCLYDTNCENIVFWSSLNGDTKILPQSDVLDEPGTTPVMEGIGFGYDFVHIDYKVVRISTIHVDGDPNNLLLGPKVELYSFMDDSWRGIDMFRFLPTEIVLNQNGRAMPYPNGIFFLWTYRLLRTFFREDKAEVLLSFDLTTEEFQAILLPEVLDGSKMNVLKKEVFVLNEYITIVAFPPKELEKTFDVWVLLEYGVQESWTKLFSVGPFVGIERPLWVWKNGEILMENRDGELVMYNPFTGQMKDTDIAGVPRSLQIVMYNVISRC